MKTIEEKAKELSELKKQRSEISKQITELEKELKLDLEGLELDKITQPPVINIYNTEHIHKRDEFQWPSFPRTSFGDPIDYRKPPYVMIRS